MRHSGDRANQVSLITVIKELRAVMYDLGYPVDLRTAKDVAERMIREGHSAVHGYRPRHSSEYVYYRAQYPLVDEGGLQGGSE